MIKFDNLLNTKSVTLFYKEKMHFNLRIDQRIPYPFLVTEVMLKILIFTYDLSLMVEERAKPFTHISL